MSKRTVHIIDGSGYIFRAYYAIRALSTVGGEPTNAVYGFTTMIEKALREEKPEYISITFDTGQPTFRRELYTAYKANRGPPPEDLPRQIPRIHEVCDAFNLKKFMVGGFEADDVIATLTKMALEQDFDVELITGDKDLMQLVNDRVRIYEPMRGGRFGSKQVEEKFGVAPEKLLDLFALCGDTSDNIPGVKGVGPKTAAKLLIEHGDLEGVLSAAKAGKVKGKISEAIVQHADDARLSKQLCALKFDVPLDISIDDLKYRGPDRPRLRSLFAELEFRRLIEEEKTRLPPAPDEEVSGEEGEAEEAPPISMPSRVAPGAAPFTYDGYETVTTLDGLHALSARMKKAERIGFAVELSSPHAADADVVGMAFSTEIGKAAYIPLSHRFLGVPPQLKLQDVLPVLEPVLRDERIQKASAESKLGVGMWARHGIRLAGLAFDSTIASYLLEPDDTSHGPSFVSRRYLGHDPIDRPAKLVFDQLPFLEATRMTAERAEIAWRAMTAMKQDLEDADVLHVLKDVEIPLLPVLARMELAGVRIDVGALAGMSQTFAEELVRLEKACYDAAGKEFNIGSPKQLQKILFEELGLKMVKRTKTGPSTDASVLEILADSHPLPQAILDFRQVQKLKSTYVDALPKMVSMKTGRVHTTFSQTVAATGRLSSTDPNLQNIPIRSDLGRTLRRVFIADPGNVLISVDYSQIELRVLAHFCEDPILMDAFTRHIDVHTRTAAALFQIDPKDVNREQRTQAKAVNFGVVYGMGPVRLARDLKLPRRTASKFIEDYFERQKGVKQYLDDTLESARKNGFVRTLLGRRRIIHDINSENRGMRAQAERIAVNTPIQGSSADLIKLAMVRLDGVLEESKLDARLLLQVHDELLVEAKADQAEKVAELVKREMEHVYPLRAPLLAEAKWGKSWDEAH